VVRPGADGELVSVFDFLPGRGARPDEGLQRKQKDELLGEFKAAFELSLGTRQEVLEVFRRTWDGERRREVAQGMGVDVERVKALQLQLRRRLSKFAGETKGGMAEMLVAVKEGE
jgi:signal recognition particle GTPase